MVLENVVFLLNRFIRCSAFKNIVFCWVLHEQGIIDGSYVIDIHDVGRYRITVENGTVFVSETSEAFDLSLDHIGMMCRLFDPMTAFLPGGEKSKIEKSWFPIPIYFPHMDNV